jgi:Fic family protein
MLERAGRWRTNLSGEAAYRSFMPSPLPPDPPAVLDGKTVELLVLANKQVTVLEEIATRIPDVSMFISMYVRKEALMSSQIEGTQASLDDILDPRNRENVSLDVADVINYVQAIQFAINRLKELPLCNRLLRETHAVLMKGVRGQEKNPGEFRRSQNWIGSSGGTLKDARYVPPSPEDMEEAMSALEKYMNSDDSIDALIRAALIHYQFETIHPFLDGNGRVGRLLNTLFLMQKGVLSAPALYTSYFLKRNQVEYYDRMTEVRDKGNYEQWIAFFLQAIYESALDATQTIDKLIALHERNLRTIAGFGRGAKTAIRLFAHLEQNPIIEIPKTATALGATFKATSDAVKRLSDAGILVQTAGGSRDRVFAYEAYIAILR